MERDTHLMIKSLSETLGLLDDFEKLVGEEADIDDFFKGTLLNKVKDLKAEHDVHHMPLGKWILIGNDGRDCFPPPTVTGDDNMDSPIVRHLLKSWSQDEDKVAYIVSWVNSLSKSDDELHADFAYGLQIVNIDSVMRDAFFSILIPVIINKIHGRRPDPLVYLRRRYKPGSETTLLSDFVYDLRIKITRSGSEGEEEERPRRNSSVGDWWESDIAPNLKNLGENIIQSPFTQNLVSILPPALTGGLGASGSSAPAQSSQNESTPSESEKAELEAAAEQRREEDRKWSSAISSPHADRGRTNSADSGTRGIGADDQAPHRALRSSEAAMLAYDFDEPLKREASTIPALNQSPPVLGAVEAAKSAEHKKSIIEAKLAKLREGHRGVIG